MLFFLLVPIRPDSYLKSKLWDLIGLSKVTGSRIIIDKNILHRS